MTVAVLKSLNVRFFSKVPDVFSAIRPIYWLTYSLGLTNYKIAEEVSGRKRYRPTMLMTVKSLMQFGFLIGIVSYDLVARENEHYRDSMADKIGFYQDIMSCSLSVANMGFGLLYSAKMCKIINKLHGIDLEFAELGVAVNYGDTFKWSCISLILSMCSLLGELALISYLTEEPLGFLYILRSLANFYPYFLNIVVELQYANYGAIIRDRYRTLNDYLEALFVNIHGAWFVEGSKPSQKIQGPLKPDSEPSSWIDTVACFHIKLADVATVLNETFRVQLLFLIATAFIGIVTALFSIAINFKDSKDNGASVRWNYMFTCWAFTNILALVIIVHTTAGLCDEANRCPKILHKIRNKTANSTLHETIEMYSLQMYHNRLQFHVCGLFALDYTLLYTIVASVTTHLVILIQFSSAQRTGGAKSLPTNNISQSANGTA